MPRLCLNMIVKNEVERIERMLDSVTQHISSYVITDTGSTDGTEQKIKDYFTAHKVPGIVTKAPFKDWAQARNAALIAARQKQTRYRWDWLLLCDADMELNIVSKPDWERALDEAMQRGVLSLDMEQRSGTLHYLNRRLVSRQATGLYKGVTHEYLDVHGGGQIDKTIAYFKDHADGSNRPEKFKRDIELLLKGLEAEPKNERYMFYLAQSYRDGKDIDKAMEWYKKRVDAGGWPEEQWNAQVNYASCLKEKGDMDGFIREMLVAYNMRPTRAETMYDLATTLRQVPDAKQAPLAAAFAEVGMSIPRTSDGLFVNDYVYNGGLEHEFAISAFYSEAKRAKGFKVCSDLTLRPTEYEGIKQTARANIYYYIPKLSERAPSFKSWKIPFTPPEGWSALNPSVTNYGANDHVAAVVRTVNYRIDDNGAYWVGDKPLGDTPIVTRNYLLDFMDGVTVPVTTKEIITDGLPMEWPLVQGLEDVRLVSIADQFVGSATCRQLCADGQCEQVAFELDIGDRSVNIKNLTRMLRNPRGTEKNWAPIPNAQKPGQLWFMYRPGHVVSLTGQDQFVQQPMPLNTDILCGSSQLIGFGPGFLALVHSSHTKPGSTKRYYYHRFVLYSPDFKLLAFTLPFVFEDKQIEFAAGIARHPTEKGTFLISYGVEDKEAKFGSIAEQDVVRMLWPQS